MGGVNKQNPLVLNPAKQNHPHT